MFHLRGARESRPPVITSVNSSIRARSASPPRSNVSPVLPPSYATLNSKLKRGLSRTSENFTLVREARAVVLNDVVEASSGSAEWPDSSSLGVHSGEPTFLLPDFEQFSPELRAFLYADLVEVASLASLKNAGRLNWWVEMGVCQRLLPMATAGDGNCLLHAASLGMWGFHDRLLTLRQALFNMLSSQTEHSEFRRRWRWHQTQVNNESELVFSEEEWKTEWETVLTQASPTPRSRPCDEDRVATTASVAGGERSSAVYASLEQVHVFALAQVLQRAVIVVSDTILRDASGCPLAPIPFGGIYLPCGVCAVHRTPLILAYDAAHFSPLVAVETDLRKGQGQSRRHSDEPAHLAAAIPLVGPDLHLLPIHFVYDPGAGVDWQNPKPMSVAPADEHSILSHLSGYLDIAWLPEPASDKSGMAKQVHTVARQFGSLGRSMSRKFKGLTGGGSGGGGGGVKKEGWVRPGSALPCARLVHRRPTYQQNMLDNYIAAARERLAQQQQQQHQQKQQQFQQQQQQQKQDESCVVRDEPVLRNGELSRQNTLFNLGKSKFYTLASEEHSTQPTRDEIAAVVGEQVTHHAGSHQPDLHLARSSFYDYDYTKPVNSNECADKDVGNANLRVTSSNGHNSNELASNKHVPVSHTPASHVQVSHTPASHVQVSQALASHVRISQALVSHIQPSYTLGDQIKTSHTPGNYIQTSQTPGNHIQASCTPGNHIQASHTPGKHIQASHTPGNHIQASHTPGNHIQASHTPGNHIQASHSPGNQIQASHTPDNHIQASHTHGNHIHASHTPGNHIQASHTPGTHIQASHTPGTHIQASHIPGNHIHTSYTSGNHIQASHTPGNHIQTSHTPGNYIQASHTPGNHIQTSHTPANYIYASDSSTNHVYSTARQSFTNHTHTVPGLNNHTPRSSALSCPTPTNQAAESSVPASYHLRTAHLMRSIHGFADDHQTDGAMKNTSPRCQTVNCPFFSRASTDFLCSTCYKAKQSKPATRDKTKL